MKNKTKIKYTNESLGKIKIIKDNLPAPEDLVFKDDVQKITISLSKSSVIFFKKQAQKHQTKYQQMIRRLLDYYARSHFEQR